MRHTSKAHVVALFFSLTATLFVANRLFAADRTSSPAAKPSAPATKSDAPVPNYDLHTSRTYIQSPSLAAAKPSPQKTAATAEKLRNLGALLGRALDVAVDLLSGNETELLSKNKTALLSGNKPEILSGNKPEILSGNKPEILSGNKPKLLSGNRTPILSGNTFSMFSNIKVEIHINNSCNNVAPSAAAQPHWPTTVPNPVPYMVAPSTTEQLPTPVVPGPRPSRTPSPNR
ncbi:MAG: hypothetical protein ABSG53_25575 [Thermoguttaceae bacterium]|jgi:hypothetical protein